MNKTDVFSHIKKMKFPKETEALFPLLERNLHRIEFVKDHLGLKNFLFLAEKGALKFESSYFACFEAEEQSPQPLQQFVSMNQSLIYDIAIIQQNIEQFLREEDRVLYVEIGFKESVPNQEDRFRVYQLLKQKEATDIQEAIMRVRKFPHWYKAKFSKEVLDEQTWMQQLEQVESYYLTQLKTELKEQIYEAINQNDQTLFIELTNRYKKVCSET